PAPCGGPRPWRGEQAPPRRSNQHLARVSNEHGLGIPGYRTMAYLAGMAERGLGENAAGRPLGCAGSLTGVLRLVRVWPTRPAALAPGNRVLGMSAAGC